MDYTGKVLQCYVVPVRTNRDATGTHEGKILPCGNRQLVHGTVLVGARNGTLVVPLVTRDPPRLSPPTKLGSRSGRFVPNGLQAAHPNHSFQSCLNGERLDASMVFPNIRFLRT